MTSEEFWKDDPKLFSSYQKAYIEKQKMEADIINYTNWLQGLYIYDGLSKSLTSFGYGFIVGKQNPNPLNYPEEPYDLHGNNKKKKIEEKAKMQKQNQQNLNYWARIKR